MMVTKVFSGIRPSGKLHLGNYLGAIKNWIELQDKADQAIFAVVDYHGITTPYDPKTYQQQIMDVVLDYLAAGIDPNPTVGGPLLIRQSKVPQHTELAWLFNTITPTSWLERLPNYREKVKQVEEATTPNFSITRFPRQGETKEESEKKEKELIEKDLNRKKSYQNNLSLLAYPVLMAADILVYKSTLVPVGNDQKQHIDITNEIGSKFNHLFGDIFPNVKAHIVEGARIMSLKDPTKKMSKTGDEGIALSDSSDEITRKIKSATTDSGKEIKYDEKEKPAISNLLTIYTLLSNKEVAEIEKEYVGKTYVEFKNDLAEVVINFLKPFQEKRKEFENNPKKVLEILTNSEEKARVLSSSTLREVKERMGLE